MLAEERGIPRLKNHIDLLLCPDKEGSFGVFTRAMLQQTVGILGGIKSSLRRAHLA
jgi:hypothetical protein